MYFITLVVACLSVLGVHAAPKPQADSTTIASAAASSSSSAPQTTPTVAYSLFAVRTDSPIDLQPINAGGLGLFIGGSPATYCPTSIGDACPSGNATAFLGVCSMDSLVPGGQQLYITSEGEIGYTQAHSISEPEGSNPCPFAYDKPAGASAAYIALYPPLAFGAGGFMACPTDNNQYQVFASMKNATVPNGNVSDCIPFSAVAVDYDGGFAAWQYT